MNDIGKGHYFEVYKKLDRICKELEAMKDKVRPLHPILFPISGDMPSNINCPVCGTICYAAVEDKPKE